MRILREKADHDFSARPSVAREMSAEDRGQTAYLAQEQDAVMNMADYYSILQVIPSASEEVIKSSYKALARSYHPDSKKYSPEVCEQKMRELNAAYEILSDPVKRTKYDEEYKNRGSGEQDRASAYRYSQEGSPEEEIRHSYKEEEHTDPTVKKGFFRKIFDAVDNELRQNQKIIEDAFYDGMGMMDVELVYMFKKSSGLKRTGYAKALEEKGLLYRNEDGRLVPTQEFNYYWR